MRRHAAHWPSVSVTEVRVPVVTHPPRRFASNRADSTGASLNAFFNGVGARHIPLGLNASFTEGNSYRGRDDHDGDDHRGPQKILLEDRREVRRSETAEDEQAAKAEVPEQRPDAGELVFQEHH